MNQPLVNRLRDASDYTLNSDTVTDPLWEEHGFALGGRGVAVLVLTVLIGSILLQTLA